MNSKSSVRAFHQTQSQSFSHAIVAHVNKEEIPYKISITQSCGTHSVATRAFSCLVEPCIGDTVLIAPAEFSDQPYWILAILQRENTAPIEIPFDRSVRLDCKDSITLSSDQQIKMECAGNISVSSDNASIDTQRIHGSSAELVWISKQIAASCDELSLVAETSTSVIHTLVQRLDSYIRHVESIETLQASSLHQSIEGTMTIHSKDAIVSAEDQFKIEAEIVHLS